MYAIEKSGSPYRTTYTLVKLSGLDTVTACPRSEFRNETAAHVKAAAMGYEIGAVGYRGEIVKAYQRQKGVK